MTYLNSGVAGVRRTHRDAALLAREHQPAVPRSDHDRCLFEPIRRHRLRGRSRQTPGRPGRRVAEPPTSAPPAARSDHDVAPRLGRRAHGPGGGPRRPADAVQSPGQSPGDESVQDDGRQQRDGVENDEIGHVVDEIVTAGQRERARRDRAAVGQLTRRRRRQRQPRRAVETAGQPQTDDHAPRPADRVGRLRPHWMTDRNVPDSRK